MWNYCSTDPWSLDSKKCHMNVKYSTFELFYLIGIVLSIQTSKLFKDKSMRIDKGIYENTSHFWLTYSSIELKLFFKHGSRYLHEFLVTYPIYFKYLQIILICYS